MQRAYWLESRLMTATKPSAAAATHGARLAALEKTQETMAADIHGIRAELRDWMTETRRENQRRDAELLAQQRTPWAAISGVAGVMVAAIVGIVSLGANGPLRDLARLDEQIDRHSDRFDEIRSNRFMATDGREMETRLTGALDRMREQQVKLRADFLPRSEINATIAEVRAGIARVDDLLRDHMKDGHPARVEALVSGIEARVQLLEQEHRDAQKRPKD